MNIVLIGMPASGKSTVGVVLAKKLGYDFLDTDILIQKKHNRLLEQIISDDGLDTFLSVEEKACCMIQADNTVISTGGSVIYSELAMKHLKASGTVVWLIADVAEISKRIGNVKQRGVVLKKNKTIDSLYNERMPLYERWADFAVKAESVEAAAEMILAEIKKLSVHA